MNILKRSVIFQVVLFTFFFFFGTDYILRQLLTHDLIYTIIEVSFLGLVVIGGIVCVLRTNKEAIIVVSSSDINKTKFGLYGIALGLLVGLIGGVWLEYQDYFLIIAGAIMSLSSLFGLYLTIQMLFDEEQ